MSILRPPIAEGTASGTDLIDKDEWKQVSDSTDHLIATHDLPLICPQVFDILWSDPQHNSGCQPNSLRGAGTYFGPDVTLNFLQKNKLVFLVRSHECKHEGYEVIHNEKVYTIRDIARCL